MAEPLFLFAHGAGAPSEHPWMQRWAKHLSTLGTVSAFDYPYMKEHRKRPDPLPKLIAAHRNALALAREGHIGPIVLIGKSMGGRVGCHVACQEQVLAVVCLGYPLCAAGDRTRVRAEVLRSLSTPILFVQGTRDSLCPLDLLAEVRNEMKAPNELYVVEGGDHSLLVAKGQLKAIGKTQDQVEEQILEAIRLFVAGRVESGVRPGGALSPS
jgi:predicted alpha/beta-hydrolase family hydrolase